MRTVVFDLDGTLADTAGDLLAAANACFAGLGHPPPLSPGADDATALRGGRAMLRLGVERLDLDPAVVDAQYDILLSHYGRAVCVATRLFPGALAAMSTLAAAGHPLAVCTNKPEGLAVALLDRLGVRSWFGGVVGADTLPVRKPDPAPLHEAVRRAGGDPARAVLIGDTRTDLDTARAAGVPVALVTFSASGRTVADLAPDALLERFADLPILVAALDG